uniref:Uncharacterized protein n=1 Tax=Anguilla anguilla TaxID=7936 RepID=A0A0E9S0P5_ANGAN
MSIEIYLFFKIGTYVCPAHS